MLAKIVCYKSELGWTWGEAGQPRPTRHGLEPVLIRDEPGVEKEEYRGKEEKKGENKNK
jgi:hypothetical protein